MCGYVWDENSPDMSMINTFIVNVSFYIYGTVNSLKFQEQMKFSKV